jgi:protein-S-isoprenylcysteine O-methyltransferase Ste14
VNLRIPPPVVWAIVAAAMWGVHVSLAVGHVACALQIPLAAALLAAGAVLMVAAVASLVAAKTTVNPLQPSRASTLVTRGVFRLSRNPIYVGDALILAALAVWLGQIANVALVAAFAWYVERFQIRPEERALRARFGAQYAAYCARVRRWL